MEDAILECIQQERPVTLTGTLEAAFIRLGFCMRKTGGEFIKLKSILN